MNFSVLFLVCLFGQNEDFCGELSAKLRGVCWRISNCSRLSRHCSGATCCFSVLDHTKKWSLSWRSQKCSVGKGASTCKLCLSSEKLCYKSDRPNRNATTFCQNFQTKIQNRVTKSLSIYFFQGLLLPILLYKMGK